MFWRSFLGELGTTYFRIKMPGMDGYEVSGISKGTKEQAMSQ
jgi:hypothetical protein